MLPNTKQNENKIMPLCHCSIIKFGSNQRNQQDRKKTNDRIAIYHFNEFNDKFKTKMVNEKTTKQDRTEVDKHIPGPLIIKLQTLYRHWN